MKLYLSGIKSYHLDLGIESVTFSDPRLERTLHGIKRDHNEPDKRDRIPLTRPYLLRLLDQLGTETYEKAVTPMAFTLAFAAFLRVGEFAYRGTDDPMGVLFRKWFLTRNSVRVREREGSSFMELTLPASKTDPFRYGIQLTIAATNDVKCPVKAMQDLMRIDTHQPPFAPPFCIGAVEQCPFTREHVVKTLQDLAISAGLGCGAWNGHSFRRGAATWASAVGIADTQIQTLGRWRSDAYKTYIEYSVDERISLS